jgi:hypothetical protein
MNGQNPACCCVIDAFLKSGLGGDI